MLLELGVPQGRISIRDQGGHDSLPRLIDRIGNERMTGYVKVSLTREGEKSEGIISFAEGSPSIAIYVFQPLGMKERWFLGDKAVTFLWEDATNPVATIGFHIDAPLLELEASLPLSKISKIEPQKSNQHLRDLKHRGSSARALGKWTEQEIKDEMDRKKVDEQAQGVYELILQYHRQKSQGASPGKCSTCGEDLDVFGNCPHCLEAVEQRPKVEEGPSFNSFLIGPSNKFAAAASEAIAANPGVSYNPLLIEGGPGLGKTHLLQAIENKIKKVHPQMKVVLAPSETLEKELGQNVEGKLKNEALVSDILLIDDIQYFAGKEQAQEELLRLISNLIDRGKQVVVTCDRSPKEIPSFNQRLLARLDGGLMVDIQSPEETVRLEVIRRRAAQANLSLPDDVMQFIAQTCTENMRQLEGGLNRVAAFSSLMHLDVTLDLAKEVLGVKPDLIRSPAVLEKGHSYLIEESRPEKCSELVAEKMRQGYRTLIISRTNPSAVRQKLDSEKPEVLWLTEHESSEKTIPPSLEKIILLIEEFLQQEGDSILLIDDLHYLISSATFEGVIRFVRTLVDQISEKPSIFLLSINPDTMKVQEKSILEREMEPIRID